MSEGNDMVQSEEVVSEDLNEVEETKTTPEDESSSVSDGVSREDFSKLEKLARENQARADRAEAKLKDIERSGMSDLDRLQAENDELREQNRSYEIAWTQQNMELRKRELIDEMGLPPKFSQFIQPSYDESEMRSSIGALLAELNDPGKAKAPLVAGGTPSAPPVVDAVKAAKEKNDPDALIRAHREAQALRRQGG